jgi:hypothetical protein
VADLMVAVTPVSVDASLWDLTRSALQTDAAALPVISPREGSRFIGVIATADVLRAARRE